MRRPAIGGPIRGTPFGVFALRPLLDFAAIALPRAALVAETRLSGSSSGATARRSVVSVLVGVLPATR